MPTARCGRCSTTSRPSPAPAIIRTGATSRRSTRKAARSRSSARSPATPACAASACVDSRSDRACARRRAAPRRSAPRAIGAGPCSGSMRCWRVWRLARAAASAHGAEAPDQPLRLSSWGHVPVLGYGGLCEEPFMRNGFIAIAVLLAGFIAAPAGAAEDETQRAQNAVRVLNEIMQAPDKAIPKELLETAHAIAVIPDVIKAGFVLGGRHGEGLIAVKMQNGAWSNPSFVNLTGGSVGFQAGVSSTDVVLVLRTQRGVDSIVHGKFTLGADASAAAGPVGRTATASTDAQLKAEIYSYSR